MATLDRAIDELLDSMGNPVQPGEWKRRALVVGVQSGKTASCATFINKAADAGYRMVILLTGMLENVRRQTQERLDSAFVGFDSRDFLTTGGQVSHKSRIGVGSINGSRDGIVFTSRDNDFRRNTASALGISLDAVREPVLVVSKKNKAVLERLAGWLKARNADRDGKIDVPMFLIDDEADNASINTRPNPTETTAINKAIRDLLKIFRRSSYVGFTATPFANIFIDPASTDEMLGDDLFPSDFIHVLEPPNNYIGMNLLFPPLEPDDMGAGAEPEGPIRTISDEGDWLPPDHKNYAEVTGLSDSLLEALRCFLLATTIRDLRAARDADSGGGGIHRSMLVNVSRFTIVQNHVADALDVAVDEIRRAVRLYGSLSPARAESSSPEIAALAQSCATEFANCGFAWPEVLAALHEAISPIVVQPVNQTKGAAALDYSKVTAPPGVRVVAVGGNSLSRGLTLEGLSTSYFLRNARTYDTLLQMGRWFGYRDGYDDLCRVWVTAEAEGWYRHVTEATGDLKRDFARMRRRQATPEEFGLRVRTHPDTLLITARNKMASGVDVTAEARDISLIGRMIESTYLYADERRNRQNYELLERLCNDLNSSRGLPVESPHRGAVLWHDVPVDRVATFIDDFVVHPLNHDYQDDAIAEFLRDLPSRDDMDFLSLWTVGVVTTGEGSAIQFTPLPDLAVTAIKRQVAPGRVPGSIVVSARRSRVGSPRDVRHGLSAEEIAEVRAASGGEFKAVDYREKMQAPLLLIYLISGVIRDDKHEKETERPYRSGLILPALGLHFPGKEDASSSSRLVRYRLNRVAQAQLFPVDLDDDEPVADDDDRDD
ncbi:MAG: Z1 domain-containing protein [Stellaceae bacterium]